MTLGRRQLGDITALLGWLLAWLAEESKSRRVELGDRKFGRRERGNGSEIESRRGQDKQMELELTSKCQRLANMKPILLPSSSSSSSLEAGKCCLKMLVKLPYLLLLLLLLLLPKLEGSPIVMPSNQVPQSRKLLLSPSEQERYSRALAGQFAQHPDAPKLIPLSALDRYHEGAELKLFCSASAPPTGGKLQFEWRRISGQQSVEQQHHLEVNRRLHISMMDDTSSVLRIAHLEADDSGNYTCLARNQHGFDSSMVRVQVNVRLKWIREPPSEVQVKAGKFVQLECDASGQPAPLISWTSLRDHQTVNSRVLRIERVQVNDSGLYECRAGYQKGTFEQQGEALRKLVKLIVNAFFLAGKLSSISGNIR